MADAVWLDYSLARPTDAQLLAAKTFGVCRYLSFVNSLTTRKIIWQAEYDHLLGLCIAIHLNYEWYEGRMAEGNAAGQVDGTTALTQANALGYPRGLPITFSDDTSGTPLAAIRDYLNGVKTGLSGYYKVGYYGPINKLDSVLGSGHAVFGWQPTAWSGGVTSSKAHLFQYFGGAPISGTDLNKVLREPSFAWYAGGDMAVTPDEMDQIADKVVAKLMAFQLEDYTIPGPGSTPYNDQFQFTYRDAHNAAADAKKAAATAQAILDKLGTIVVPPVPDLSGPFTITGNG